jgi:hypothetical protein
VIVNYCQEFHFNNVSSHAHAHTLNTLNTRIHSLTLSHSLISQILLFKYVDDKDVFQKFYSKNLARRLIHNTSVSDDAEKFMIAGLKETCGFEYTSKLQRMFNDIQLSNEINDKFKEYCNERNITLEGTKKTQIYKHVNTSLLFFCCFLLIEIE